MKVIGKILREAREEKGLSLDAVHKAIKIQEKYLSAIEGGDMSVFLAEIYYKTFMKSYAKYLGLDSEMLAKQYEEAKQESAEEDAPETVQGIFSKPAEKKKVLKKEREKKEKNPIDTTKLLITLLIAVCLLAGFIYLNKNIANIISENSDLHEDFVFDEAKDNGNSIYAQAPTEEVQAAPAPVTVPAKKEEPKPRASLPKPGTQAKTMPVQPALPAALPPSKQEPARSGIPAETAKPSSRQQAPAVQSQAVQTPGPEQPKPKAAPAKQKLAIEAVENVWIRVESDGREVFQGTVIKGSQKEWQADTAFVLKVGYTPGIKVLFNGEPVDIVKGSIQDVNTVVLKRQ